VKPLRVSAFADAVPFDKRGHCTPQTLLLISERNHLLIEATRFFAGASDRPRPKTGARPLLLKNSS
jgi:hypothetical protein